MSKLSQIVNLIMSPMTGNGIDAADKNGSKKNLSRTIAPQQLARIRADVKLWREAIKEAELAYFPYRVKMQQIYNDTVLNGHVIAAMGRRKDLSVLRDFTVVQGTGKVENEAITLMLKEAWFYDFLSYALDAIFYGYTLVSVGDIVKDKLSNLSLVRRWNVSPDRMNVTAFQYGIAGQRFDEEPFKDWHIWLPTPSDNGVSPCGYGLLYYIAIYEIHLRNVLGYNGDFVELYSQPYRVGKTSKTDGDERKQLEAALQQMGSSGWAILDPTDEIAFLETALGGTGWQGYENFEKRCEHKISKIILGHADAIDSIPGKLGATQGLDSTPVGQALSEKQSKDGRYLEEIINNKLFDQLRTLGFNIPMDCIFAFKNDDELEEFRRREDESNQATALIASTMALGSLQMSAEYFTERTGIPTTIVAAPAPIKPMPGKPAPKVKAMLNQLYP